MLPKRHNRTLFVWLLRASTRQRLPRGEVCSGCGAVTMHGGGAVPLPVDEWRAWWRDDDDDANGGPETPLERVGTSGGGVGITRPAIARQRGCKRASLSQSGGG